MPEQNDTAAATKQLWILSFSTKPPNIDTLPVGRGPGTKGGALRLHWDDCFRQLDERLEGTGIQVENRLGSLGTAFLRGSDDACLAFKAAVEADGFARMMKNEPIQLIY